MNTVNIYIQCPVCSLPSTPIPISTNKKCTSCQIEICPYNPIDKQPTIHSIRKNLFFTFYVNSELLNISGTSWHNGKPIGLTKLQVPLKFLISTINKFTKYNQL